MKVLVSVISLAVLTVTGFAQSGSSTISGNIKDATGAVIPGAKVKIVNQATGFAVDAISNDQGLYRAVSLVPGSYRVEVSMEGFDRLVRGPVVVDVGQVLALDLTLQIGQSNQTITVTEAAPLVESQSSNVSQLVNQQMLIALPLPNRTASSLAALAPGVVMIDAGSGTAENYPVFSVAGGRARNQNFILDGGNVSNAVGLTRPQQLTSLPVDAMQEFRVIANNYSAEYGHSTGGIVTMSTRSGTNQYHGSLFESLQNNVLNARNFFAKTRPPVRLNQFGGSFGGPIQKDKTHFFVTWEQTRQLSSDTVTSTVPTLLNRTGDFSDIAQQSIYDPATGHPRVPFAGNKIPLTRLDPVALAALNYFPTPNLPGPTPTISSGAVRITCIATSWWDAWITSFSSSDTVTARYYINDANTNNSGTYGIPASDPLADITDVRVQSILVAHTHTFGPTLSQRSALYLPAPQVPGYAPGLRRESGGANRADGRQRRSLSGLHDSRLWSSGRDHVRQHRRTDHGCDAWKSHRGLPHPDADHRPADSGCDVLVPRQARLQVRRGNAASARTMKFGTEARPAISPSPAQGTGLGSTGGNGFASFLLGDAYSASIQVSDKIPSRASYVALYFQDDWRVTDRLTINAGLR